MSDLTPEALDALQEHIAQKAAMIQMGEKIEWGSDAEALNDANAAITALRAQLATARTDALREAANLCGDMAQTLNGVPTGSPHSQDAVDVIASGLSVAQKAVLSLIDTPTPSTPSPETEGEI